jgi:hypothetical protein
VAVVVINVVDVVVELDVVAIRDVASMFCCDNRPESGN